VWLAREGEICQQTNRLTPLQMYQGIVVLDARRAEKQDTGRNSGAYYHYSPVSTFANPLLCTNPLAKQAFVPILAETQTETQLWCNPKRF
jgi:hypothetical protein